MLSAKSFALVFIDLQQTWIGSKQKLAHSMSNHLPLSIFFHLPVRLRPKAPGRTPSIKLPRPGARCSAGLACAPRSDDPQRSWACAARILRRESRESTQSEMFIVYATLDANGSRSDSLFSIV
jgi:hypothetical protein